MRLRALSLSVLLLMVAGCSSNSPGPVAPNTLGSLHVSIDADATGRAGVGVTVLSAGSTINGTTDAAGNAHLGGIAPGVATVTLHGLPSGYGVIPGSEYPIHVVIRPDSMSTARFTLSLLYDTPQNDSPQNTMIRFQRAFEYEVQGEYANLFARDFRFAFSSATDPTLVTQYGLNWGKSDETTSSNHFFNGFTSSTSGEYIPGATNITMTLNSVQYFDDPSHPDSAAYYKFVRVERVLMSIEVPGPPEPQIYNIDARHEFYLVRGDAAVLDPGQEASSGRWYIHRWDDLSSPVGGVRRGFPAPQASSSTTWGSLKARYRQ